MILFHVSPCSELDTIDPQYSKRAVLNTWLCKKSKLRWAIEHTKKRHRVAVVTVYAVRTKKADITRMSAGKYTTTTTIPVENIIITMEER